MNQLSQTAIVPFYKVGHGTLPATPKQNMYYFKVTWVTPIPRMSEDM